MKKLFKKGFTIVELVIVIAVIAILAAVLIPTFSGVVAKANLSAAQQTARSTLTNALNMSSTGSLAVEENGVQKTIIAVDGYAFGYSGNQLIQIDYPTAEANEFKHNKNFNSILIALDNLEKDVYKNDEYKIKNVDAMITNITDVNGAAVVKLVDNHYYLNYVVYTEETAAKHNATLDGHKTTDDVKTQAVYFTQAEINAAKEGDPAFNKTTSDKKTEEVKYTDAECVTENAKLSGAVKAGDFCSYDAEIFVNSDFSKKVVVLTTFSA